MEFGPAIIGSRCVEIVRVVALLLVHLIGIIVRLVGVAMLLELLTVAAEVYPTRGTHWSSHAISTIIVTTVPLRTIFGIRTDTAPTCLWRRW
jgi:hypothetical protein